MTTTPTQHEDEEKHECNGHSSSKDSDGHAGKQPGQCSRTCSNPCDSVDTLEGKEKVGRAEFVRTALGGVAICWAGMTMYPIYMYLNPKKGEDEQASKITSLEVCKLSELPRGHGRNFRFGSTPALVIHAEDGTIHAFKAICTHLGCTVQFRDDINRIYCACHGGQYDPLSGKNVAGPPPKPLAPLKAEVVDGKIIVSRV